MLSSIAILAALSGLIQPPAPNWQGGGHIVTPQEKTNASCQRALRALHFRPREVGRMSSFVGLMPEGRGFDPAQESERLLAGVDALRCLHVLGGAESVQQYVSLNSAALSRANELALRVEQDRVCDTGLFLVQQEARTNVQGAELARLEGQHAQEPLQGKTWKRLKGLRALRDKGMI